VRNAARPLEVCLTDARLGRFDAETKRRMSIWRNMARDAGVSRRHAVILLDDETLKIMDLGSANATYLNGQKLIARQARILRDGDELRLGKMTVHVHFA
jgi:predicted component of type VI protein secretion system